LRLRTSEKRDAKSAKPRRASSVSETPDPLPSIDNLEALMRNLLNRLVKEESGGEVIDYVLVLGLIVILSLTVMSAVGNQVLLRWRHVLDTL
jgi:Flp pilus assembly pilin Flp